MASRRATWMSRRCPTFARGAARVTGLTSLAVALMVVAAGAGCQAGGGSPEMGHFPTLDEVGSRVTPVLPEDGERPFADAGSGRWAMVRQVDLPLAWPIDAAWDLVDEAALSAEARRWYNANGVRVGLLSAGDLEAFAEHLPAPVAVHQSRVRDAGHPVELRRSPRLSREVALTLPGDAEAEPAVGGSMRLLAQMRSPGPGRMSLALVPHHHVPEHSLLPRDPLERELDGRVFEELTAGVELSTGRLLVIGLHHELEAELEEEDWDDPAAIVAEAERLAEALPVNLGRALLTARRAGRPVQVLVMVALEP